MTVKTWLGRSTVRTLAAGHRFKLADGPLESLGDAPERSIFVATAVISAGINNLPRDLSDKVAAAFDEGGAELLPEWVDTAVRAQVAATGYANAFQAIRADVPWRPSPIARPKAPGLLTATVVGADGSTSGSPEIHTDRLGRIRIRHDFQAPGEGSTWVRVMQPYAGAGMGHQFIPRIGQQVLVGFFDDDMDRPFVQAAVYTGRGEGGIAATPGGQPGQSDASVFGQSGDHRPAGQGNLTGGNAPPWHGAGAADIASGGQANAAALSGWKTQEFTAGSGTGQGFNQLVFDDSNQQLRTQLATTQHATQLNLGHLIHQADNHRGSFRGLGFELRTDAYGTIRAKQGVLLSSFGIHRPRARMVCRDAERSRVVLHDGTRARAELRRADELAGRVDPTSCRRNDVDSNCSKSRGTGMTRTVLSFVVICLLLGCQPAAQSGTPEARASAPAANSPTLHTLTIYGYNYTNRYIDQFYVNGEGGGNMDVSSPTSSGGGGVCCMSWRDGTRLPQTLTVRWVAGGCMRTVTNSVGESRRVPRYIFKEHSATLNGPVPAEPGYLEVHIYPDEHVEVAITATPSEPRLKLDPMRSTNPYPEKCKVTE